MGGGYGGRLCRVEVNWTGRLFHHRGAKTAVVSRVVTLMIDLNSPYYWGIYNYNKLNLFIKYRGM